MPKTSTVTLAGNTISITRDPTGSNIADLIDKQNVTTVAGVFNKKPNIGHISHGAITGNYTIGETITGGTSGATATFMSFKNATTLTLNVLTGTFVSGETLTGGTSTATSTSSSALDPRSYDNEWIYPYPTMTVMEIELTDGSKVSIELQDVSNQSTWSTGLKSGLQAAIAALNAFL